MNFYKFITLTIFIFTNMTFANDHMQEYKIEIILYKNKEINTKESFLNKIDLPNENIIKLFDVENENDYSNFSNISEFFSSILDENVFESLPEIWFREDDELKTLGKLHNNISKNPAFELLTAKSWIQTIPSYEASKFLNNKDLDKKYDIFLKLYKKRFMHMHAIAYIENDLSIYINEEKRIFNEEIYLLDHPYFGLIISIDRI